MLLLWGRAPSRDRRSSACPWHVEPAFSVGGISELRKTVMTRHFGASFMPATRFLIRTLMILVAVVAISFAIGIVVFRLIFLDSHFHDFCIRFGVARRLSDRAFAVMTLREKRSPRSPARSPSRCDPLFPVALADDFALY
jgi:hypothetical protein